MIIKDNSLAADVLEIIRAAATERPHTGRYQDFSGLGSYLCRGCGAALFRAESQFAAGCGWPSFDAALQQAVAERADPDGLRTEIVCARCQAHLGHLFLGEGFTASNQRYCVNAKSLDFVKDTQVLDTEEAIVAGGCFWGIEHYLAKLPGVLYTEVGYIGGVKAKPTYYEVCVGNTGHYEATRIIYAPKELDYAALLKYFFEIHDPSQADGQGPDRGSQYQSAVFYYDDKQRQIAGQLIKTLEKTMPVATKLLPVTVFWQAEADHQQYYLRTGAEPYCHVYTQRFWD